MASVTFYQHKETRGKTLILITFTFNQKRLRLSSGISVPTKSWDSEEQKAKPLKDFTEENGKLRKITSFLLDKYDEIFAKGLSFSKKEIDRKAEEIREAFRVYTGRKEEGAPTNVTLLSFITVFQERYMPRDLNLL